MGTARIIRHIGFCIFAVVTTLALCRLVDSKHLMQGISISTAYVSLLYFAGALLIGPIYLLLSRKTPISIYLRRDLGIWSAILAVIHTIVGLQVHLGGNFINYFIYPADKPHIIPVRYDPFGLTNYLGLVCTIIMIVLLILSNNRALGILGAVKWKRWQRSTYFLLAAIPIHGLVYQILEKRTGLYTMSMLAIIMICTGFQISGIFKYRNKIPA
jgi:sulfoxide reductase heme-binding subunit YedZ